jgi:hypothetical protein
VKSQAMMMSSLSPLIPPRSATSSRVCAFQLCRQRARHLRGRHCIIARASLRTSSMSSVNQLQQQQQQPKTPDEYTIAA